MLNVISLGAGVQSSTMALMAAHGEITPMPDAAIFADTQDEPAKVYRHLEWLSSVLPFPVYTCTRGKLSQRLLDGDDEARIPAYVGAGGLSTRQCTRNYKIKPVRRKVREILGVGSRSYIPPGAVSQWIGISTDEAWRIKPSGVRFTINRHPLIEKNVSREDCARWLWEHYSRKAPKSACRYCPFQGDIRFHEQKMNEPEEWVQTVAFDHSLRTPENIARFRGELYLHPSRQPLDEVDLAAAVAKKTAQTNLFNNECEGMCGV